MSNASKTLRIVVLSAVIAALVGVGLYYVRNKTYLRVAAGPERSDLYRIIGSFMQVLNEDSHRIRVKRVATETAKDAREAMDSRAVDLCILRADQEQPRNSETIAVLRRDVVFMITPAKSNVESLKDLRGKTVGLLSGIRSDARLLDLLLGYYGVDPATVTRQTLEPAAVGGAAAQKKIAAVFVVGQPGSGPAQEAFSSIARATKATPNVVAVEEAEAIAKRFPYFDTTEIPKGAFGGASPQPDEAVTSLSLGYRLLAHRDLPSLKMEALARQLMTHKARMAAVSPAAAQIEAPDTGKDAFFRVHAGAASYFDGEETSLFDRFESFFYIGAALLSVMGSMGAWFVSRVSGRKLDGPAQHVRRLMDLLTATHEADGEELNALEAKAESEVRWTLKALADNTLESSDLAAVSMALEEVRRAIDRRRAKLARDGA